MKTVPNMTWGNVEATARPSSGVMSRDLLDKESSHLLDTMSTHFLDSVRVEWADGYFIAQAQKDRGF